MPQTDLVARTFLQKARQNKKMSQSALCETVLAKYGLRIGRASVANWEAGRYTPPLFVWAVLADVLELDLNEVGRHEYAAFKAGISA